MTDRNRETGRQEHKSREAESSDGEGLTGVGGQGGGEAGGEAGQRLRV